VLAGSLVWIEKGTLDEREGREGVRRRERIPGPGGEVYLRSSSLLVGRGRHRAREGRMKRA